MTDTGDAADPADGDAGMPDLGGLLGNLTGGGGPLGGGGGLGDLFAQAQEAMSASQAAAGTEVEGSAGGGLVKVRGNGAGEVLDVKISPTVVDPADVEGLEDLVLAALRDMATQIASVHAQAMGGFDPSAMLGGLFGGGDDDAEDDDGDDGWVIDVDGRD